ncbi:dual specificity protein phosphatase family protein [Hymenobacter psoromatis]|uniref:dual specificity protein phosphatase family protein n=1 Tax=Hymenobacter psoromatis TaxID=1484116 RepID=UPI001CBD06D0|nr:dual specificity protein phosphatase family protein [Hymenobacter psoromatis]
MFQKTHGRQSWAARLLLAPYRLGTWWSSRWLTRGRAPAVVVAPGIWLGWAPGRADWPQLPIGAVLDVAAEFSGRRTTLPSRSVPLLDLIVPSAEELAQAVAALDELVARTPRPVLVHCALGHSQAAVVVAAWLLRHGLAATTAAVARVRAAQPRAVLGPAHRAALVAFLASQPIDNDYLKTAA